jgi:hypothetical protein
VSDGAGIGKKRAARMARSLPGFRTVAPARVSPYCWGESAGLASRAGTGAKLLSVRG